MKIGNQVCKELCYLYQHMYKGEKRPSVWPDGIKYSSEFSVRGKLFAGLIIFLLMVFDGKVVGEGLQHRQIRTQDGLPSNTVYAILQDKKGDIWFATEYGVSRFNGFCFENFNLEHGLSDNDVFKLFQDSKGRIWFFLSSGKVNYFEKGKIHNPENTEFLRRLSADSYFNGFIENADGSLWFTTLRDGVFILNTKGQISRIKPVSDLAGGHIAPGIIKDGKGEIKVCTQAGIINLSRNPGLAELPLNSSPDDVKFSKMLKDGRILLGLGNRLLLCEPEKGIIKEIGPNEGYNDNIVSNIQENTEGDIWISAINGLHVFRKGIFNRKHHQVYVKGKTLSGFLYDRQGNLWISTLNEGVCLVTDKESVSYGKANGIPDLPLTSLFFHKDKLFFGNDRGAAGKLDHGRISMLDFGQKESLPGRGRIREFKNDPYNPDELWIVSENGNYIAEDLKIKAFYPSGVKSLEFNNDLIFLGGAASCIMIDYQSYRKTGEFVMNTGLHNQFQDNQVKEMLRKARLRSRYLLPKTRVYKILKDESGTIWMATHSGLFSQQFGKVIYHREQKRDFGHPFQNACLLGNGMLALSSNGRGILLLHPNGKTQWISAKEGLPSNYIRKLRAQGKDSLWVCTPSGLGLVSMRYGDACFRTRNWTMFNSGLLSNDVFDVAVKNDSLWLAVGSNLQCLPSFRSVKKFSIPRAEAESISINDQFFYLEKEIELESSHDNIIRIRLRNPDYRNLGKITFQYRLLPDSSWKAVNGNLIEENIRSSGNYSLEIRRMLLDNPDAAYPLIQIRLKNNITSIQSLRETDWYFRLPIFAFIVMMLLAIFIETAYPSGGNESSTLHSPVWDKIRFIQKQVFLETKPAASQKVLDLLIDFRAMVWKSGNYPLLADELNTCSSYFRFLAEVNPDFSAVLKMDADLDPGQFSLNGHNILEFTLFHCSFPPASGSFELSLHREGNGITASLRNNSTGAVISTSETMPLSQVQSGSKEL